MKTVQEWMQVECSYSDANVEGLMEYLNVETRADFDRLGMR